MEVLRFLLYWAILIGAIAAAICALRYREAPSATCVASPQRIADDAMTQQRAANAATAIAPPVATARYRIAFDRPAGASLPLALMVGRALPFHRLTVNGADITPGVDLAARDVRDMAPHLHVLPTDVLHARDNVALLELPDTPVLGALGVEQICVGPLADLEPAFRMNWWRMVGTPRICLLLYLALGVLAIALWLLSGRHPAYVWYVACLVVLAERSVYLSTSIRPGGPNLWIHFADACLLTLPYAMYGFMRSHWRFPAHRIPAFLHASSAVALACACIRMLAPSPARDAMLEAAFVLCAATSCLVVMGAILRRAHSMHRVERRAVIGICIFAFVVSLPEVANFFVPFAQRWMWTNPPATIVLAMGLGYLLIRRMAIGGYVFSAATEALAGDLDRAISVGQPSPRRAWALYAAGISRLERGRLIRDIHDGFGARLVGVLAQARRELPHSPLLTEIHRALLDMRLMIDAMDDSMQSLADAIARLRYRIEQANADAADRCDWRTDVLDDVMIGDRARLVAVYRCLEELLSEMLADGRSGGIVIDVRTTRSAIWFGIAGEGGWNAVTIDRTHRLVRSADGGLALVSVERPARCEFYVPLF